MTMGDIPQSHSPGGRGHFLRQQDDGNLLILQREKSHSLGKSNEERGVFTARSSHYRLIFLSSSFRPPPRIHTSNAFEMMDCTRVFPISQFRGEDGRKLRNQARANQKEESSRLAARLPHSSLFWPRKGQTLDDYIRESDSKTRTDVEKVISSELSLKSSNRQRLS